MRIGTLCFLVDGSRILLAMKKVGFGRGKWNGFGGKVRDGETVIAAAAREIREEAGVRVRPGDLEPAGELTFFFAGEPKWHAHAFLVRNWQGEPIETGEMRPQWFALDAIPYNAMWVADREWLPLVLAGHRIEGEVRFDASGDVLEDFTWREVAAE